MAQKKEVISSFGFMKNMVLEINHKDVILTSGEGKALEKESDSSEESHVLQTLCDI